MSPPYPIDIQIELRELQGLAEMQKAEQVQIKVWQSEQEYDNRHLLRAVQYAGGLVGGAFAPGGEMVGFVLSFPTRDPAVQHSHRLAVLEDWRSAGIGTRLKWFQRTWALERGIQAIHWTVDPLRAGNAELNIRRLGASAAQYMEDYYGVMSGINAGAPSDRILVEWQLSAPQVIAHARQTPPDSGFADAAPANPREGEAPGAEILDLAAARVQVNLPLRFEDLLVHNQALALAWRLHTRRLLQAYFRRGYRIAGFTRLGGPAYCLVKESVNF